MKIKRYEGKTQQEVMEKVKEELGPDALVLNITETRPKGLFAFFKRPLFEVTVAYDDKPDFITELNKSMKNLADKKEPVSATEELVKKNNNAKNDNNANNAKSDKNDKIKQIDTIVKKDRHEKIEQINSTAIDSGLKDKKLKEQETKISGLAKKLELTQALLDKATKQLSVSKVNADGERIFSNNLIQVFYDSLIEQDVLPELAEEILWDIDESLTEEDKLDVNQTVRIVYNKIRDIIGEPKPIVLENKIKGKPKIVIFIGSTGVGKTTTIAKISANLLLNEGYKVGLITADTYRIAAVEQLKIYADILGIEVGVVYNNEDMQMHLDAMRSMKDIILIDTAGRSHRNHENLDELNGLLSVLPEYEAYLVISITTKLEDILGIIDSYKDITDFKVIFTKFDETIRLGSVLNVCYKTGRSISYITDGQNVPEDIRVAQPELITKALLGLGE